VTENGSVAVVVAETNVDVAAPEEALENTKGTNVEVLAGVVVVDELAAAVDDDDAAAVVLEGALEDVGASDGGANDVELNAAPVAEVVGAVVLSAVVEAVVGMSAAEVGPADWKPSSS